MCYLSAAAGKPLQAHYMPLQAATDRQTCMLFLIPLLHTASACVPLSPDLLGVHNLLVHSALCLCALS